MGIIASLHCIVRLQNKSCFLAFFRQAKASARRMWIASHWYKLISWYICLTFISECSACTSLYHFQRAISRQGYYALIGYLKTIRMFYYQWISTASCCFLTGLGLVGGRGGVGLEGAEAGSGIISMRPARNHQVAVFGSLNLIFSSRKTITENRSSEKSFTQTETDQH